MTAKLLSVPSPLWEKIFSFISHLDFGGEILNFAALQNNQFCPPPSCVPNAIVSIK